MPHYNRAPIFEAIIDFRAGLPEDADPTVFDSFAGSIKDRFPVAKPITTVMMAFQKKAEDAEGQFVTQQGNVGLRLETGQNDRVVQVQRPGFTYSHLPPYSDWATFRDEARALWSVYLGITGIRQVTRLAVRVINKIGLQASIAELPRFSNLQFSLPRGIRILPDTVFAQFQMNAGQVAEDCRVVVNAGAAPQQEGKLELLLDFDIFVAATKDAASPDIWQILDRMSEFKNELFEASITDAVRELIA